MSGIIPPWITSLVADLAFFRVEINLSTCGKAKGSSDGAKSNTLEIILSKLSSMT
jgi:hypothetical protein